MVSYKLRRFGRGIEEFGPLLESWLTKYLGAAGTSFGDKLKRANSNNVGVH